MTAPGISVSKCYYQAASGELVTVGTVSVALTGLTHTVVDNPVYSAKASGARLKHMRETVVCSCFVKV